MAFITIEDLTGSIDAIVFPKIYTEYKPYIFEDSIIKIDGKLSFREEEEPKILVNRIMRLSDCTGEPEKKKPEPVVPKKANDEKLYIKFSLGKDFLLEQVKEALKAHSGNTPVYIYVEETKTTAMAQSEYWVNTEDEILFAELKYLIGKENIVLKK